MTDEAKTRVHEAIGGLLDEGEFAICWHLTIDVVGAGDVRYLAYRSGGGHDGNDLPMSWAVAGMLQGAADAVRHQMLGNTFDIGHRPDADEPGDDDGD